jgi:dipeptidyl aminopeptidase/acylaminoacyl peptidase
MPGKNFYASFSTQYNPGDLFSAKWDAKGAAGEPHQLTKLNEAWLRRKALGEVHEQWLRGAGGHKLHGWVMTPPGYSARRRYPAILYIHGGPSAAYPNAWFHEFQYLAGQGFIVIYSNPRGGTGYGLKHKAAIARGWGKEDYSDLLRFTDHCEKAFPAIDPARIGVAGGSYGGYMTNWIIGHTSAKAAV